MPQIPCFGSWELMAHSEQARFGGICLGGKIAPIFHNTMEDSGALPIELRRVLDEHR